MDYDAFEHRHRFSAWAAARAAQRGFASVVVLRDALQGSGIVEFVRNPATLNCDATGFDAHHRRLCTKIISLLLRQVRAEVSYGRAAKLVAVYLKSMFVLGPAGSSSVACVAHPPIDSILLRNLAASDKGTAKSRARWRTTRWTRLDRRAYFRLIGELRKILPPGAPFWTLEQYWTVTET
jgi:hypothetical protein